MTFECVKTGAHALFKPYGWYIYGDMFKSGDMWLFRIVHYGDQPVSQQLHYEVLTYQKWFDQYATGQDRASTLVASSEQIVPLGGYDGVPTSSYRTGV